VRKANAEPRWLRWTLTGVGLGFLFFFLALPLVAVFFEALPAAGPPTGRR
jgi:sulfate transport system permease protein